MHLGLDRPFMPHINSWESCYFTEVPDGPQTDTVNILLVKKGTAQIHMSE
jgi:hypothetical protein